MKKILFLLLSAFTLCCFSADYVVVNTLGKVFDEPNAKGYVTLNSKNKEVVVTSGMVFKVMDKTPGWSMVEYSPGLRGYISDENIGGKTYPVKPGKYKVNNSKDMSVYLENNSGVWNLKCNNISLKGFQINNLIIFPDKSDNVLYSVTNLGNGPLVFCYDNSITKFF